MYVSRRRAGATASFQRPTQRDADTAKVGIDGGPYQFRLLRVGCFKVGEPSVAWFPSSEDRASLPGTPPRFPLNHMGKIGLTEDRTKPISVAAPVGWLYCRTNFSPSEDYREKIRPVRPPGRLRCTALRVLHVVRAWRVGITRHGIYQSEIYRRF